MSYEPGAEGHRILFVCNPASGGSDDRTRVRIADALRRGGPLTVLEPSSHEAFSREVREASESVDLVVVGGGDGTFGDAVNALSDRLDQLLLALVPMGTGNDLARSLGLPREPDEAAAALLHADEIELDVGRATGSGVNKLFVNACAGGLPVAVNEAVSPGVKTFLGPLAFWVAGVKGLARAERFTAIVDDREIPGCLVAGVGNGKTCGGGSMLWPQADPSDGLLDSCAIAVTGPASGIEVLKRTRDGSLAESRQATFSRANEITLDAEPQIELNVDGDLVGLRTPATFAVATRARVLVPRRG